MKFTEDYRRRRRERVLEIQHERAKAHHLPPVLPQSRMLLEQEASRPVCDDGRVQETEIFVDESRRSRRRSPILRERVV